MDFGICNITDEKHLLKIQQEVSYKDKGCFTTGLSYIRERLQRKFEVKE
jgi:hypothetical protein